MGKVPGKREQGSGRCAGQLCQPDHQILPLQIREAVPEAGRYGPDEEALIADITARGRALSRR